MASIGQFDGQAPRPSIGQRITTLGTSLTWRRLRNRVRILFGRGDFSSLLITCALMVIPAIALSSLLDVQKDTASWPIGLNQLIIVGIASVIFGFLLARSHYNELMALLMSAIYGITTVAVLQVLSAPGDPVSRVVAVVARLRDAIAQTQSGAIQDPFLLILFLSTLFWFLGHNTAWHVFRIDRVWRAVVPPGIVLLINGLYNFGPSNLDLYLILYVFLSLLLVVRSNIDAHEFDWYINHIGFDRKLRRWFYRTGAIAGIAILLMAWALPTGSPEQNQKRFQQFVNGNVLTQLNRLLERLFTPLDATGTMAVDYYGRDKLQLGGAIQLGDQEIMSVTVPQGPRYYWKSRVFDTYNNGEWDSQRGLNVEAQTGPLNLSLEPYAFPGARQDVTQTFTVRSGPSDLIYAAPQARQVSIPAQADADYVNAQTKTINPSVIRPLHTLGDGDTYSAISSINTASADQLRQTATIYAPWLSTDLILDANVAPRARALAAKLVNDAKAYTAYDKAKVIESWLRANITYDEYMPTPPTNEDVIDWALFKVKRAYCTYYASAMVVMLRSEHVPARLAAGFAQGTWDDQTQSYVVRERDAHTWVEAYFPGVGWVEFEPTSAQPALDRRDPRAPPPTPTATPTFTPSPTLLPSPTPASKPQNGALQTVNAPTSTPTMIPSPTATLTATPLPAAPPSLPKPLSGALALGVIGAIIIAAGSFAGVGVIWWIEYRGLDKLSPVGRAYARLAIYARWLRIPAAPGNTPLERGRRIARELPEQAAPIVAITDLYINERYAAPHPLSAAEEHRANTAWQSARWALIRRKIRQVLRRG